MTLEGVATMDTETFCDKIREYKKLLYVTAWSVLQNEHEAEDAVSAAVLSAYEHLSSLKKPESFKAWIVTITKNEALIRELANSISRKNFLEKEDIDNYYVSNA